MLEDEAELGSDDEDNDDVRKKINRNDEEEDEEGLDDDLDGFVAPADEEIIDDPNYDMHLKFQLDMEAQEKLELQRTMQAVLFGQNNKKRRRDEIEGGMDSDDEGTKKMRRMIELRRQQMMQNGTYMDDDGEFDLEEQARKIQ